MVFPNPTPGFYRTSLTNEKYKGVQMDNELNHSSYLTIALDEAEAAAREGDRPIGAVLVTPDGQIIARGHNRRHTLNSPLQHAEMHLFFTHQELLNTYENQLTLYTSLEPCIMCMATAITARMRRIVWALNDPYMGWRVGLNLEAYPKDKVEIELIAEPDPDLRDRSRLLLISNLSETDKLRALAHIEARNQAATQNP